MTRLLAIRCPEYIYQKSWYSNIITARPFFASLCVGGAYDVLRTKTEFDKIAFFVAGPKMWNELPVRLRQLTEIGQFKRALKTHLFDAAYN